MKGSTVKRRKNKAVGEDPVVARMRRVAPTATDAELHAATHLFIGAPLHGFGRMKPERAIAMIRNRASRVSPEQERVRIEASAAPSVSRYPATDFHTVKRHSRHNPVKS